MVKKSVFCDFLAIQKSNLNKLFFCFVGLNELLKIKKKFIQIGSLIAKIIAKTKRANCINFGKIGHLKNMSCMRDVRGPSHTELQMICGVSLIISYKIARA